MEGNGHRGIQAYIIPSTRFRVRLIESSKGGLCSRHDRGANLRWFGPVLLQSLLKHYLPIGMLPVHITCPAVIDRGIVGGRYGHRVFAGNKRKEGEEESQKVDLQW